MAYKVIFKPSAARDFRKLPGEIQKRIAAKIQTMSHNPRPLGAETLQGPEKLLRIRAGDYRIIYQVRDKLLIVLVVKIGHRREVYR